MAVYDRDAIQGAVLALDEVRRQVAAYASQTMEERRRTVGLVPQRADVILAGACIVEAIMELCGRDRCSVSDRGIRHGMMARLFQGRSWGRRPCGLSHRVAAGSRGALTTVLYFICRERVFSMTGAVRSMTRRRQWEAARADERGDAQ
jgi:hypothetical protein